MIVTAQTPVGTTAVRIAASDADGVSVAVQNRGPETVFLGPSGVTTSTGYAVDPDTVFTIDVGAGESVYGIVESGTTSVHSLVSRL